MTATKAKSLDTEYIMYKTSAFPGFSMASDVRTYPIM
jgi:hypothetical protein